MAPRSETAIWLHGVGTPCLLPKRTIAPLRASISVGRPAAWSACREFTPSGAAARYPFTKESARESSRTAPSRPGDGDTLADDLARRLRDRVIGKHPVGLQDQRVDDTR